MRRESGEPAGDDPFSKQFRRIPSAGARWGWGWGEYLQDCLQPLQERCLVD